MAIVGSIKSNPKWSKVINIIVALDIKIMVTVTNSGQIIGL